MTVLIILPDMWDRWDRVLEHFKEATVRENKTGFVTRVVLHSFDGKGLPVYSKIPDDRITYVETIA